MGTLDEIRRRVDQHNRRRFKDRDRAAARQALAIYMREVIGVGLRYEFDYFPFNADKLQACPQKHLGNLKELRGQLGRFLQFIQLLKTLEGRAALQPNPTVGDAKNETLTRIITSQEIATYRAFHEAVTAYLNELSKKNPDLPKAVELACQAAAVIHPEQWRQAGVAAPGNGFSSLETRWFLKTVLADFA
ncbi:MAG TPA: hypothetical protein VFZ48_05455 [Candidatus Saccharimonadales bacterium]